MPIKKIQLHQLRSFDTLAYEPGSQLNFIVGPNGSGKTTLLEAIYILSMGRSFRTSSLIHVIQNNADSFVVHAELTAEHTPGVFNVGFQRERRQAAPLIKINGKREGKIADLAKIFPVKLLCVDNYQLLRSEPQERRQLIDWGVFHVEHSFFPVWQQYHKLLKHRNTLLKNNAADSVLTFWTEQLVTAGEQLHLARVKFMQEWLPTLQVFMDKLLNFPGITVEYCCGWNTDSLEEAINNNIHQDRRVGYSQVGPHRADLNILVDGISAKQRLSLGQQKMLVTALHLSQASLLREKAQKETVFLLDDLPAELDNGAQQRIGAVLHDLKAQVFITCVDSQVVTPFAQFGEVKMFHVEHSQADAFVL
jgi:DNA replication and repair protein RecF